MLDKVIQFFQWAKGVYEGSKVLQAITTIVNVATLVVGVKGFLQARQMLAKGQDILANKTSAGGKIPVIYGTRRVGAQVVYMDVSNNDSRHLFVVYALSVGEVDEILGKTIQLDGNPLTDSARFRYGCYVGSDNDSSLNTVSQVGSTISAGAGGFGTSSTSRYRITFNLHHGAATQTADPMLVASMPNWTSAHKLNGIAYIAAHYKYDKEGMFAGVPQLTVQVRGKKVYDPRDSGQTFGTVSTYEYSSNPALCFLDFITNNEYGKGLTESQINMSTFSSAANVCDTEVDNPFFGGTSKSLTWSGNSGDSFITIGGSDPNSDWWQNKIGELIDIYDNNGDGVITGKEITDIQRDEFFDENPLYRVYFNDTLGTNYSSQTTGSSLVKIKRFHCNGYLDTNKNVMDNAKELLANMRGIFLYIDGKYELQIEDTGSSSFTITDDHIIADAGISVDYGNKDKKANKVIVEFFNANKRYELDTATVLHDATPNYYSDDNDEILEIKAEFPYVTDPYIAYNMAKAILVRSRKQMTIQFLGTPEMYKLNVGDIVTLNYAGTFDTSQTCRVEALELQPNGLVAVSLIEYFDVYTWETPPEEPLEELANLPSAYAVKAPTGLTFTDSDSSSTDRPILSWTAPTDYPDYEFRVNVVDSSGNQLINRIVNTTEAELNFTPTGSNYVASVTSLNTLGTESDASTLTFSVSTAPVGLGDIQADAVTANTIDVNELSAISADMGSITAGSMNIGSGNFTVSSAGVMTATGATISGNLTATSLNVTNATVTGTLDAANIQVNNETLDDLLAVSGTGSSRILKLAYDDKNKFEVTGTSIKYTAYDQLQSDGDLAFQMDEDEAIFYPDTSEGRPTQWEPTIIKAGDIESNTNQSGITTPRVTATYGISAQSLSASSHLFLTSLSSAPSTTTNKLYNDGGTLYWNGSSVNTGAGDITGVTITTTGGSLTGGAAYASGDATFTLDIGSTITGAKTFDNNVVIQGNLDVQGTTTTIDTTNLDVKDKNITLNYSTGDSSANANGAGITIQDAVSAGNDATLTWNTSDDSFNFSHNLNFADSVKAQFGASNDLQIYHDGFHSFITDSGTGNLRLQGTNLALQNATGTKNYLLGSDGGAVTLYHNNSPKLATTSTGIDVTGSITASADISVVESGDAKIISNSVGDYFPSLEIKRTSGSSKTNYSWAWQLGSSGFLNLIDQTNSYYPVIFKNNGDVALANDTDSTNPVLLLDKSTGNVGIGLSNPSEKLHIYGTSATISAKVEAGDGNQASLDLKNSEGEFRLINDGGELYVYDSNDAAERFRINTSGNVGIGATSIDEKLHIEGSVNNDDIAIKIQNTYDDNLSTSRPAAALLFQAASTNAHLRVYGAPADTAANHQIDLGSTASGSFITFSPQSTEAMRINPTVVDVNVFLDLNDNYITGVNSYRNVNGTEIIDANNTSYTILKSYAGATRLWLGESATYLNNTNFYFRDTGSNHLVTINSAGLDIRSGGLDINSLEVIDSSRNLTNIGTISSGAITSSSNITTQADSASAGIKIKRTNSSTSGAKGYIGFMDSDNNFVASIDSRGTGVNNSGDLRFTTSTGEAETGVYNLTPVLTLGTDQSATFAGTIDSGAINTTGAITIDVDDQADGALRIEANQTNPNNDFYFAQEIISTLSGTTATTGDREQGGIYMDINSTATGGDTSNEHRAYGMYIDIDSTGDADLVYGVYSNATATPTTGTTTNVYGGFFHAEDNGGAGNVTTLIGVQGTAVSDNSTSDVNAMYAGYFKSYNQADSAAIGASTAVYGEIEIPDGTADIYGSSYVFQAQYDNNGTVAQTNTTYLFYGNYAGVLPTNAYGIYIADAVDNYFGGAISSGAITSSGEVTTTGINIGTDSGDPFNSQSVIKIQDGGNAYIQMKAGTSAAGGVLVGDTDDDFRGGFIYSNSTDALSLYSDNVVAITLDSSQNATFAGTIDSGDITSTGDISGATIEGYVFPSYPSQSGGVLTSNVDGDMAWSFNTVSSYVDSGDNRVITSTGSTGIAGEYGLTYSRNDGLTIHNYNGTGGLSSVATLYLGQSSTNSGISNLILDSKVQGFIDFKHGTTIDASIGYDGTFGNKLSITCGNGITFGSSTLTTTGTISSGAITCTPNIIINASGTSNTFIEVGANTSSNHYAYVDLIGDATYTDYGLRIIRNNGGANTSSAIYHRGTGNFSIETQEAAAIKLRTAGADALTLDTSQNATFAGTISSAAINTSDKVTISNANYNQHLEIARSGQGTLSFTPSANQLLLIGGGFSPSSNNAYDLGRTDKYWQDLWLGTSLKMGGTTVIDSDRNLDNINSIDVTSTTSNLNKFTFTDTVSNAGFTGLTIDYNASGSQAHTTDNTHRALFVDVDTSQTGGNTTDENRTYGIHVDVRGTGDTDLRYGIYSYAETQHSSGTVSSNVGLYAAAVADDTGTGHTSNNYAVHGLAYGYNSGTGGTTNHYGGYFKTLLTGSNDKNTNTAHGIYAEVEIDDPGQAQTVTNTYGVRSIIDNDSAGNVTMTNAYLFFGDYQGTIPTGGYGLYIGDGVPNYFGGEILSANNITAYYSDERLKDFHGKIENPIDKVKQLNGYYFTENKKAKELGYDNDKQQVGVNAQEVQKVLPEVVDIAPISHKEDVNEEYLTVHYDKLVPLLIEAIKDQQQQIDELKARLDNDSSK